MRNLTSAIWAYVRQEEGLDAAEKQWKKERAGGNYGAGTKEIQARNYVQRKENERKRREMFDDALAKFKENDIQVCINGVADCRKGGQLQFLKRLGVLLSTVPDSSGIASGLAWDSGDGGHGVYGA